MPQPNIERVNRRALNQFWNTVREGKNPKIREKHSPESLRAYSMPAAKKMCWIHKKNKLTVKESLQQSVYEMWPTNKWETSLIVFEYWGEPRGTARQVPSQGKKKRDQYEYYNP